MSQRVVSPNAVDPNVPHLLLPAGPGPSPSSRIASVIVHLLAIGVLLSLGGRVTQPIAPANPTPLLMPSDLHDVIKLMQPDRDGGGGGGDRSPTPAAIGRAPKFSLEPFAPPEQVIRAVNAKLEVDPSLPGPPDLQLKSPDLPFFGDPNGKAGPPSNGPGGGGGMGSGCCGGVGPGNGPGSGPGPGGPGIWNGNIHLVTGATNPVVIYSVDPEFTDAARRAKFQGTVLLNIIVDADGHVADARVARAAGLGLDERAIEAVKQWRFKPGTKDGRAVPVAAQVQVTFRLL